MTIWTLIQVRQASYCRPCIRTSLEFMNTQESTKIEWTRVNHTLGKYTYDYLEVNIKLHKFVNLSSFAVNTNPFEFKNTNQSIYTYNNEKLHFWIKEGHRMNQLTLHA